MKELDVIDTRPMGEKRFGICSVCHVSKRVNDSGLMKLHTRHGKTCDGSCLPPWVPPPQPEIDRSRDRVPSTAMRRAMLKRDGYRCKKCRVHSPTGRGLEPHHVVGYAEGGLTTLDNLDTLCATCHAELSWVWLNQPPIGYARWLEASSAAFVMTVMLAIAGECRMPGDFPIESTASLLGVTPEQAKNILFGTRPP